MDLTEINSLDLLKELVKRGGHPGMLASAALVAAKKSLDYNENNNNIHEVDRSIYFPFGIISYAQMIFTKALRFKTLSQKQINGETPNFESLFDTALDLINYAGFFMDYFKKNKL